DDEHDGRADEDPGELIPMEEGNACEPRLDPVIGRHPHDRGEGNNEKQPRPMTQPAAMLLFSCHDAIPPWPEPGVQLGPDFTESARGARRRLLPCSIKTCGNH